MKPTHKTKSGTVNSKPYGPILYINSLHLCVRLSDATVLRFNSPAEPARTVGQTPLFTAWLFICLTSRPLTFLRGPRLGKPWCATTPPLWLVGVTSTERPNLNTQLQPLSLATTTLHRRCLLRWPHYTQIIPKSLCGTNPKRRGTSKKG